MKHVIDALKASKRKATHQRDNWKRRAEVYRVVLEEIASGPCCGCCADDDPQCDVGRAKDALRTANTELTRGASPSRPAVGSVSLCDSCARANVSCPIYPQETQRCVEYKKTQNAHADLSAASADKVRRDVGTEVPNGKL